VYDLVISDISMPGLSGLGVLKRLHESSPETPVMLITAYGSKETAIEAVKLGAFDYFEKPFNVEEVKTRVGNALAHKRLASENTFLRRELKGKFNPRRPGREDAGHLRAHPQGADTSSTIMISGESGTGKEQIAAAVHYNSVRRDRQFVSINCGALPAELLESELFGHMRGAFTSAVANKQGSSRSRTAAPSSSTRSARCPSRCR
jgi:DNA-binding NtrC family response regulator